MAKILIVDDEATFRKLAQSRLEASGYDVITADHGIEAPEARVEDREEVGRGDGWRGGVPGGALRRPRGAGIAQTGAAEGLEGATAAQRQWHLPGGRRPSAAAPEPRRLEMP